MADIDPETATVTTIRVGTDARGAWSTIVCQAKDLMACPPADAHHRWLVDLVDLSNNQTDTSESSEVTIVPLPALVPSSASSPAPSTAPSPSPTFPRFPLYPTEIRREIFLLSVPAIVLQGKHIYPRHRRPLPSMEDQNGILSLWIRDPNVPPTQEFPVFMDRKYSDIALYSINRESRDIAYTYYGVPIRYGLPFNPFKDSLRLEMDSLEECLKYIWDSGSGDTWRRKLRNFWPELKVFRMRRLRCQRGTCQYGQSCRLYCHSIEAFSKPDPSLWPRIQSVTLSWVRDVSPVVGPFGGGADRKVTPIPFPWIMLLSRCFKQLRHITLEHAPLDDCVWADANQWPVGWIPADDERTHRPFDSSTGSRLYEISCLRVLDQLERAVADPFPTTYHHLNKADQVVNFGATRPNKTIVAKKGSLLPHLQSVTIISHDARCSHPKTWPLPLNYEFPLHLSSGQRRDYRRKWLTLYMMNRLLEIPAESVPPTAVGQTPWWPAEINDPDGSDDDDDTDGWGDSDSDVGEGDEGDFPDFESDASSDPTVLPSQNLTDTNIQGQINNGVADDVAGA